MNKLSEAQRRVLQAMRDGAVLKIDRPHGPCWLEQLNTGKRCGMVEYVTAQDLRFTPPGLIDEVARHPYTRTYAITEAGRAALQQSGVGEE